MEVDYLTFEDLLEIAAGVLPEVRVRETGLLASAAARPQTTVLGAEAYPDLGTKAAALLHSIARNHPLMDGNKRLAWSAMRTFLLLNDADVAYTADDAEAMVLGVAAGDLDIADVTAWLASRWTRA